MALVLDHAFAFVEGGRLDGELARYLPDSVELLTGAAEPRMTVELDHPCAPTVELAPLVRIRPAASREET